MRGCKRDEVRFAIRSTSFLRNGRTFSSEFFLSINSLGKGCLPFFALPLFGLLRDDATAASAAAVTSSSSERYCSYPSSTESAVDTRFRNVLEGPGDGARSLSRVALPTLFGEAGADIRRCLTDAGARISGYAEGGAGGVLGLPSDDSEWLY